MLSDLPIGTAFAGIAFDLIGIALRKPRWHSAARTTLGAAVVSGSATALVGLWDYQAVPHDHPARKSGALHGYLNASALTLLSLSLTVRTRAGVRQRGRPEEAQPGLLAMSLSLAAGGILVASGWLGGDLVYRLGWRVQPTEHAEQLEAALRQRGEGDVIEQAHATVWQYERDHALVP